MFQLNLVRAFTDPLGTTDVVDQQQNWVRQLTDQAGITEAVVTGQLFDRLTTDILPLTDSATFQLSFAAAMADPVGFADNLSISLDAVRVDADSVGVTDDLIYTWGQAFVEETDPLSVTDFLYIEYPTPPERVKVVGSEPRRYAAGEENRVVTATTGRRSSVPPETRTKSAGRRT
jgi:hypothetical protein